MFSKLAFFTTATMAVFVAANGVQDSCNTGEIQCCNSFESASNPAISSLLTLLGVNVASVTGQVGLTCSPITAVGVGGGSSCTSQPICCSNNSFNGVVALGCSPINIGL